MLCPPDTTERSLTTQPQRRRTGSSFALTAHAPNEQRHHNHALNVDRHDHPLRGKRGSAAPSTRRVPVAVGHAARRTLYARARSYLIRDRGICEAARSKTVRAGRRR